MCKLFHNKSFFDVNTIGWHSFGLFAHGWPIKTTNNVILSRIKICESINTKTVFWVPSPCVYKQFSFNPYFVQKYIDILPLKLFEIFQ